MVAPVEKASLLGSQFHSQQYGKQFVTPFSCFPRSRCNFLDSRTPILDLDTYGGLGMFPLFLKMVADIIASK